MAVGVWSQLAAGCSFDPDHRCGELDTYGDNERCVCPAGTRFTADGCVANPSGSGGSSTATETAGANSGGAAGTNDGLGRACDPGASDCESPYDHCEPVGDTGYCTTSGCASSEDCELDYECNDDSVCQRPPTGLGKACAGPEDCEGTEATYCETFFTNTCQVEGCTMDPDDCFVGYECCDLSAQDLGTQCVPEGLCSSL